MRTIAIAVLLTATGCAGFYRSTEAYQACDEKNRDYHRRSGRDYTDEERDRFCVRFAKENEDAHFDEGVAHTNCNTYGSSTNCASTYKPVQDAVEVPLMR